MKKNKYLIFLLTLTALASTASFAACVSDKPDPDPGPGPVLPDPDKPDPDEWEGYTKISSRADFLAFVKNPEVNGKYVLTEDILLTAKDEIDTIPQFFGLFEGNGKTIKGLQCFNGGLFGTLNGATVQNLKIEEATVSAESTDKTYGILANEAVNSFIDAVVIGGTVNSVTGSVAGGVAGSLSGGTISNVLAEITFTGKGLAAGGLVGEMSGGAFVFSCKVKTESEGQATQDKFGGAVGVKDASSGMFNVIVDNLAAVTATKLGGVLGECAYDEYAEYPNVVACYYLRAVSTNNLGIYAAEESEIPDYFNAADWKDGEPVLGTKTHAEVKVSVDGAAAKSYSYGEAGLPALAKKSVYLLGDECYPAEFPLVSDLSLTVDSAEDGMLYGTWRAAGTGETIVYGDRFSILDEDGDPYDFQPLSVRNEEIGGRKVPALYFRLNNNTFRVYFDESTGLLALQYLSGSAFITGSRFMPEAGQAAGAYKVNGKEYVLTSEFTKVGESYGYKFISGGVAGVYTASYADISAGALNIEIDGAEYAFDELVSDYLDRDYYDGEWENDDTEISVNAEDGAVTVNGTPYSGAFRAGEHGVGIYFGDGALVATPAGVNYYAGGKVTVLSGVSVGTWYAVNNGSVYAFTIKDDDYYMNGELLPSVTAENNVYAFAYDGKAFSVAFSEQSASDCTLSVDGEKYVMVSAATLSQFTGTWYVGVNEFTIGENGTLVSEYRGQTDEYQYSIIKDERLGYCLTYGDVTVFLKAGRPNLRGYHSYVEHNYVKPSTVNSFDYPLVTAEEWQKVFAQNAGTYYDGSEGIRIDAEELKLYYKPTYENNFAEVDFYIGDVSANKIVFSKRTYVAPVSAYTVWSEIPGFLNITGSYSSDMLAEERISAVLGTYVKNFGANEGTLALGYVNNAVCLTLDGKRYATADLQFEFTDSGVTVTAGGNRVVISGGVAVYGGESYYNSDFLPYSYSDSYYLSADGEYLLFKSYTSVPYAYFVYSYQNGSGYTIVSSTSMTRTGEGEYSLKFADFAQPLTLNVVNQTNLTLNGKSFYYIGMLESMSESNVNYYDNQGNYVRYRMGSLYYNGKKAEILSAETDPDDLGVVIKYALGGEEHTLVADYKHRVTIDGKAFVIGYLRNFIDGKYINPQTGNVFEIDSDGVVTYGGVEVFPYQAGDTTLRFSLCTEHGIHDFVIDFSSSDSSWMKLTDYIYDDNAYYYTEAYVVYGGLYKSADGKYLSIEQSRILYNDNQVESYDYNAKTKTISIDAGDIVINGDGSITFNGTVYERYDYDLSAFYGTYYINGSSVTVNAATFTDGTTIKGYTTFNGSLALYYGYNRIIYFNTDEATKDASPVLIVSSFILPYLGQFEYNGKTLEIGYEPFANADGKTEVRACATYDGERLEDFAFDTYYNYATFVLDGKQMTVERDSISDNAVMVHEATYEFAEGLYSVDGMKYKIAYALPDGSATADAEIGVFILDDNYKVVEKAEITAASATQLSFTYGGKNYVAVLNANAEVKAMIMRAELRTFTASTQTVGDYTVRLAYAVVRSETSVTITTFTVNGTAVAVSEAYLLQDDGAKVLFKAGDVWYVLDTAAKTIVSNAISAAEAEKLAAAGTYSIGGSTLSGVVVYAGDYDAEGKSILFNARPTYTSVTLLERGNDGGVLSFTADVYGVTGKYVVYKNGDSYTLINGNYYNLLGTFTISGRRLTVALSSGGSLMYSYGASEATLEYPSFIAPDYKSFTFVQDGTTYIAEKTATSYKLNRLTAEAAALHACVGSYIPTFAYSGEDTYAPEIYIYYELVDSVPVYKALYTYTDGETGEENSVELELTAENGAFVCTINGERYVILANDAENSATIRVIPEKVYRFVALSNDEIKVAAKAQYSSTTVEEDDDEYTTVTVGIAYEVTYGGQTYSARLSGEKLLFGEYAATVEDGAIVVAAQ